MTEDPIEAKTISSLRHIYSCCQNCTCLIGRYYQPDCFSFFAFLLTDQIHCQFFVEKLWHNGVQWRSDGLYTAHSSNSFHTCISFFTLHSKCMAGIKCSDQPKIWKNCQQRKTLQVAKFVKKCNFISTWRDPSPFLVFK